MTSIGKVKTVEEEDGISLIGTIIIDGHSLNIKLIPVENKPKPAYPDYKIWGSKNDQYGTDLGAGWIKQDVDLLTGEKMEMISANIDHFSLPKKIYFNFFQVDPNTWEARTRERQN